MIPRKKASIGDRFWPKVKKASSGCWEWNGSFLSQGYGAFWIEGKTIGAHRVAFFLSRGRWSEEFVLHVCDNKRCVRPDHLEEGSLAKNSQDAVIRGLHPSTKKKVCPKGHPYDGENVIVEAYGHEPHRRCRECRKAYDRKRRPNKRKAGLIVVEMQGQPSN